MPRKNKQKLYSHFSLLTDAIFSPLKIFYYKNSAKRDPVRNFSWFFCLFWVIFVLIFNFTKKIRDNRKRLNLFPQQWEFTASRISSRQGYGVRVTFTRTSNTVSHSPPSFPWTTGFCGIRLGSYALIPLPKFHLYNPLKQGWSTNSYSQVLWLNFASSSNPCLLPDPGCRVYHSGLRFLGSYACAELPLGTATSFLHCEEPGYSKAPSTTTCKDETQSGKKNQH